MTRRTVLRTLLAGVVAVGGLFLVWWRRARLRQVAARLLKPRLETGAPTGVLSGGEVETLVAFAEVLVDGRPLSTLERGFVAEHVTDRTQRIRGYLPLYRQTATLLDRLAEGPFARLDLAERAALLTRRRLLPGATRALDYVLPVRRDELVVRVLAVPDLLAGYYRSPAGWAVVGYRAFPGRCSDLTRYTRPEPLTR
jgi:hypothetical protein